MEKEPSHADLEGKVVWGKAYQEARALYDQISRELHRIGDMPDNDKIYDRFWNEISNPPHADRATLLKYAVYQAMIGSGTTYEVTPQIDFPGDDNLMSFYTKKLEELRQIKTATSS